MSTQPDPDHQRPPGASDATVAAVGLVSEALEWVERARGHLYEAHQLLGHADVVFQDGVKALRGAGHPDEAGVVHDGVVGRDAMGGRWIFEIVEEFDDGYWSAARAVERQVRERLLGGRRHVLEAETKGREQGGRV